MKLITKALLANLWVAVTATSVLSAPTDPRIFPPAPTLGGGPERIT